MPERNLIINLIIIILPWEQRFLVYCFPFKDKAVVQVVTS